MVLAGLVDSLNTGVERATAALGSLIDDLQYGQPREAQLGPQLADR